MRVWDGHVLTAMFKIENQQGSTIAHGTLLRVGGELGEEWINVYIWLSPCAVHLKLSQHY